MQLKEYASKRHFKETPEPRGKVKSKKSKELEFVIQEHHASHLHYDFRLEMDGVLKSWAVPKGPSLDPNVKRLAMQVEDHPYDYRTFEGEIPQGNYGAGNVFIWDKGTYCPSDETTHSEKELLRALNKGHLSIQLHGERLNGEFNLVKSPHMGEKAWLLIKKEDDNSVKGYETEKIGFDVEEKLEKLIESAPDIKLRDGIKPMLATLVDEAFDDKDWIFELKWDGYRCIASHHNNKTLLCSRNGLSFNDKYPSIAEAIRDFKHDVVLDGEIVMLDKDGQARFDWLQDYSRNSQGKLVYCVFDILSIDGHKLLDETLMDRKYILKEIFPDNSSLLLSDFIEEKGISFFRLAEEQNLEGIMAKKKTSRYVDGVRSKNWLKIKTQLRQEVVIGGFTEPKGSRKDIGALLVGVYDDGNFKYVGHVGTGIDPGNARSLRKRMLQSEIDESPFDSRVKANNVVHWCEPKLICEVKFAQWTTSNMMRQSVFMGMREDKNPHSVSKENATQLNSVKDKTFSRKGKSGGKKIGHGHDKVTLTHLNKVFWPELNISKGDLIEYYSQIGPLMLPYIKDKPHSLLRHPSGYRGSSFFQKDMADKAPSWIKTKKVYSESNDKDINYFVASNLDSLLYMAQLGCIEINPWNSKVKHIDKPDWFVIDLDPEDIDFKKVVDVANVVHEVFDELGIPSYPKTSGKTGIHIYVPLHAKYNFEQAKSFSELMAHMIHERVPKITSIERSPKKRQGKVYLDFLQNRKGQTLSCAYSLRPVETANVSTPLDWSEVDHSLRPENFTIKNIFERIDKVGDLFKPVLGKGIDISKIIKKIE